MRASIRSRAGAAGYVFFLLAGLLCGARASAQEVKYGVALWPEAGHGSHRAVVRVAAPADAVWAHVEWRRRDRSPEAKDVRVYDAATGKRVLNVVRASITRASGDLLFQPATAPGQYYVYYLPYNQGKSNFDAPGSYFPPEETAESAWLQRNHLTPEALAAGAWRSLPRAELVEIQARTEFCRTDPMEVIATEEETAQLLARHPDDPVLYFPEDRRRPIRMFEDLPVSWVRRGPQAEFRGEARPGEHFTLQVGVYAARAAVEDLGVTFTDLISPEGKRIPASALTCYNTGGTDWLGRPMKRAFAVARGRVRPLWIGVDVPAGAVGTYRGSIRLRPAGGKETAIALALDVAGPVLADHGDSELWRHSRLRWLNSTLGLDDEVVEPYTPLVVKGDTVGCLLRKVRFGALGFPESISANGREILAEPVALVVETADGAVKWAPGRTRTLKSAPGAVERESTARAGNLSLTSWSRMEFDGCILFRATLQAGRDTGLRDVRLQIPMRREVAAYLMGMGHRGGYRPKELKWAWSIERADHMVWMGDPDAGLQLKLLGEKDVWEGVTLRDVGIPESWGNSGKGGCTVSEAGNQVAIRAFTGERTLRAGEKLQLRFRVLVTPFRPIDPRHWSWRYGDTPGEVTVAHVHHGTSVNPYINYPFLTADSLAAYAKEVKSHRWRTVDRGKLTYPAAGNFNPERGSLHVWARVNFDPTAGSRGDPRYNQSFFYLDYPNNDQLGFYWNIDDRGMRVYTRQGDPSLNRYPILYGTTSPDWRPGDRRRITLSWGDHLAVFVDGKQLRSAPYKGILPTSLEGATLGFHGGFRIDAVKITDTPYQAGQDVAPVVDEHTLLLDTFARVKGGRTTPEKIAAGGHGTIEGVIETAPGERGQEIIFSARQEEAPKKGVNVYYTVGQLSNWAAEMWALRSLGDEVFQTRQVLAFKVGDTAFGAVGGGYPWLQEHLVDDYIPGWRQPLPGGETDAAIAQQGLSRWHNYYVEGMRWLMQNTGIDGLYLDGIGYDREIMKRIAKVMRRTDPDSRINFHGGDSWSPPWDPDRRVSTANQNLEHFPYISSLWFGELFDYNLPPDYWLVEISGIPFGITGEMLNYQNGGNPYRGMVYGMSGRQHPSAPAMWRSWDEFGIQDAEMIGYWSPKCPVRTDRPDVLATVYRKRGKALIALAHWPAKRGRSEAVVGAPAAAPTIDGRLDPGEWDGAAKLAGFTVWGGEEAAPVQTEAFVSRDVANLYLAFRCAQKGTPKAAASARDGAVWEDDAVEIFLQPEPASKRVFQFIGNSRGVFYDGMSQDASWNGPWIYKASAADGAWCGEASIPFAALGVAPPVDGTAFGFNACRDQQTPSIQLSAWSAGGSTFHDTTAFGRLRFSTQRPSTRQDASGKAEGDVTVRLNIDWKALGLRAGRAKLTAPEIARFQPRGTYTPDGEITFEHARGRLLVLE